MQFSITSEKENALLRRKEIVVNIDYEGKATPKLTELVSALAEHFGAPQDKIAAKLFSHHGKSSGYAIVKIWSGDIIKKNKRAKQAQLKAEEKKQ